MTGQVDERSVARLLHEKLTETIYSNLTACGARRHTATEQQPPHAGRVSRLEAIASRLEAIASRFEAIAFRLATPSKREAKRSKKT